MSKKIEVHTVPTNDWGAQWVNKLVHGESKTTWVSEKGFLFKKDAAVAGKKLAKALKCEHVIHLKNGKIAIKNSYGNDRKDRKG
jgi:hypothetical protein